MICVRNVKEFTLVFSLGLWEIEKMSVFAPVRKNMRGFNERDGFFLILFFHQNPNIYCIVNFFLVRWRDLNRLERGAPWTPLLDYSASSCSAYSVEWSLSHNQKNSSLVSANFSQLAKCWPFTQCRRYKYRELFDKREKSFTQTHPPQIKTLGRSWRQKINSYSM